MRGRGVRRVLDPPVPPSVAIVEADPSLRLLLRAAHGGKDQHAAKRQHRSVSSETKDF